ncbi:Transcriptional regulator ClgR [Corynebacterium kalinowskii]|uniref:Transcriptional regulator ClgR n=1 Tax=Corynebacterium kalinowskii TaxID=2675216 RepID=A0A6B8VDP6_9CORY|nr:helix-turn-helix transcriptional regulator [Corynebacterium kalinowskii]QGU02303.1 Transcriptional regulator ClgR [Corynebacterium kalinowskii]
MIVLVSEDLLRERIGKALREERKIQGRTLEEVARKAAISPSHLSDIERGEKEGSSEIIRGVHRALGLELDQLLNRALSASSPRLFAAA